MAKECVEWIPDKNGKPSCAKWRTTEEGQMQLDLRTCPRKEADAVRRIAQKGFEVLTPEYPEEEEPKKEVKEKQ